MTSPPDPRAGDRTCTRIIFALAGVVAAVEALGLAMPNGGFWGADAYAFFPRTVFAAAGIALLAVACYARRELSLHREPAAPGRDGGAAHDTWIYPALALAGAAMFTKFHTAHVLLGDGVVMVSTLPIERSFHPLEPLSMILEQTTFDLLSPFLARPGREPYEMAWIGSGALSILAGAVFLPVTWAISDHLARRIPGSPPGARGRRTLTGLVFLTLAGQGYMQIFFGYVEVYALAATAFAVYTLAALRFLDQGGRLWPAAVALAVAVAFHLSAVVLLPSFAILALAAFRAPERAPLRAREALISLSALAALPLSLAVLGHGYNLWSTLLSVFRAVIVGQPDPILGYVWSSRQ